MTRQEWDSLTVGAIIRNIFSGHTLVVVERIELLSPFRMMYMVRQSVRPSVEAFTATWHDSYEIISNGPIVQAEFAMPEQGQPVVLVENPQGDKLAVSTTPDSYSICLFGQGALPAIQGRRIRITVEIID